MTTMGPAGPSLRTAAYIRVSDNAQDKDGTPETQRLRIESYAAKRSAELGQSIEIVHWYQDVYTGGDSYFDEGRRDFQSLKHAIRRGEYDLVLAYKDDRIARGAEVLSFCFECQHHETKVETALDGPLTAEDILGTLALVVRGAGSKEELKKIRERASDGMAKRAHQQKRVPGCRPRYGYKWDDDSPKAKGRLITDPATGPIVQRIFREYVAGHSLRAIGLGLQADGVPTPTQYANRKNPALVWSFGTVQNILRDPIYRGAAVALKTRNQWERNDGGRKRPVPRPRPEHETVTLPAGTVPPLVDEDVFAIAQERLALNRALSVRNNPDPDATILRAGLAVCDYCGHPLVTRNAPRNKCRVYECSSTCRHRHGCPHFTISAHILDGFVWSKVAATLRDPETIIAELRRQRDAGSDTSGDDLAAIDRELADMDRKLNALARDVTKLAGSEYATASLLAEMKILDSRKAQLVSQRNEIEARRTQRVEDWESWDRWVSMIRAQQDDVDAYGPSERREVLIRFGVKARVRREGDGTRISVTANIDLDRFEIPRFERPRTEGKPEIIRLTPANTHELMLAERRYYALVDPARKDGIVSTTAPHFVPS